MNSVPEALYKITWKFSDEEEQSALANHDACMQLARVLEPAGAVVNRVAWSTGSAQGRHAAPDAPVDEPLYGAAADRVRDQLAREARGLG